MWHLGLRFKDSLGFEFVGESGYKQTLNSNLTSYLFSIIALSRDTSTCHFYLPLQTPVHCLTDDSHTWGKLPLQVSSPCPIWAMFTRHVFIVQCFEHSGYYALKILNNIVINNSIIIMCSQHTLLCPTWAQTWINISSLCIYTAAFYAPLFN